MHKFFRLYNQNRIIIWAIIIAIVFGIAIIQTLNSEIREEKQANLIDKEETTLNNVVSYDKQSESIISPGSVSEQYRDDMGEVIDRFFIYCVNHQPEKAYDMLSSDMKNLKYPTQKLFETGYYNTKFEGDKQYTFQSWSTSKEKYVYIVNIFDNMLSTGKSSKESYYEDFITVVPDEDTFKINIDGYIGRRNINKSNSNDDLKIEVVYSDEYMSYEIYSFRVKNNTNNTIMLDTKEDTKNTYIVDENGNKSDALVYENNDEDLIIKPKEAKTIQIKFNNTYSTSLDIRNVVFSKIVDYNEYLTNKEVKSTILNIEI